MNIHQKGTIGLLAIFGLLGAGCADETAAILKEPAVPIIQKNVIPELNITSPGLEAVIDQDSIDITGTSNQDVVHILNTAFPVIDGQFNVTINMEPGETIVPVAAGNGTVTTTINIRITRTSQ